MEIAKKIPEGIAREMPEVINNIIRIGELKKEPATNPKFVQELDTTLRIEELPAKIRPIARLIRKGYRYKEISKILHISEQTIKQRLYRFRKKYGKRSK